MTNTTDELGFDLSPSYRLRLSLAGQSMIMSQDLHAGSIEFPLNDELEKDIVAAARQISEWRSRAEVPLMDAADETFEKLGDKND